MKKYIIICFLGMYSLFNLSCTGPNPEEELAPEEKDVYVTNYDPNADFSTFNTYYVDDSILMIHNERYSQLQRKAEDIAILNTIRGEMNALGYTEVDSAKHANVGVSVAKISTAYTGINYSYGGYGNPYGFYDPYMYGYGYSYPTYYVYQVKEGSVIIDIVDLSSTTADNKLKVVWSGQFIDGLGSLSSPERIENGIKALFLQSTVLKK